MSKIIIPSYEELCEKVKEHKWAGPIQFEFVGHGSDGAPYKMEGTISIDSTKNIFTFVSGRNKTRITDELDFQEVNGDVYIFTN